MINVENDFDVTEPKSLSEVAPGEAFIGTVEDINGDECTGVFIRTADGITMLDDPAVEFESFSVSDPEHYVPKVAGFKYVDITVRVDSVNDDE